MASAKTYEDLIIWQKAKELGVAVYKRTGEGNISKDFYLRDQIRRSALSISANIAEGFERNGNKEFVQFLSIAKGSCGELRSHLTIAVDLNFINKQEFTMYKSQCEELSKMISSFIGYLKSTDFKGVKFKSSKS